MHGLLPSPAVPPGLSRHECGAAGSASHHLVGSASCSLACPIPQSTSSLGPQAPTFPRVLSTQLPISAPATGLDECFFFISLIVHTVRFSVSSGCFLFLNCCCPSFGYATRRRSVSTYASVLAGSSQYFQKEPICVFIFYIIISFISTLNLYYVFCLP